MDTVSVDILIVLIFGGVEKCRILMRRSGFFTEIILAEWKFYGTENERNSIKADQFKKADFVLKQITQYCTYRETIKS